jgi:glucose-6-phosphate isomerase
MDVSILRGLVKLAEAVELPKAIQGLLSGETVNNTENRPALHRH